VRLSSDAGERGQAAKHADSPAVGAKAHGEPERDDDRGGEQVAGGVAQQGSSPR
jgi:hypothetical protein